VMHLEGYVGLVFLLQWSWTRVALMVGLVA
jgi:hypothetical protein